MSLLKLTPDEAVVLLLFGAGGHGRVVADAARSSGNWPRITASDRNPTLCQGELLPGIQLVEPQAVQPSKFAVHIAIGSNAAREREAGFWGLERLESVIHPAAVMSSFSHVGAGSFIAAGAVLAPGAHLGKGVIVNHCAVIDHDATVGAFCHVAPHATLGGAVFLGQRVLIGSGAVVLPSVHIADDVIVGAGAVVTADIRQPGTYIGIPARRVS
jgi:acetyltransferase EpsM